MKKLTVVNGDYINKEFLYGNRFGEGEGGAFGHAYGEGEGAGEGNWFGDGEGVRYGNDSGDGWGSDQNRSAFYDKF